MAERRLPTKISPTSLSGLCEKYVRAGDSMPVAYKKALAERAKKAKDMRADGKLLREIAEELGITASRAQQIINEGK